LGTRFIVVVLKFNLIILGSPIWYFRPAQPLWTFVEKNNFQGKAVVLFNTFNIGKIYGMVQIFG
jgi:hypothetical protein